MKVNHVHAGVRDLPAALQWLETVFEVRPTFTSDQLASVTIGSLIVILDRVDQDQPLTIGFETDDCDHEFKRAVGRGAVPIESPNDKEWGVRAAYIKGPGALIFEFEQGLATR
jgi:catechol 2,3-dioxygenase-like lactoylglutathione lyase family enzyme